VLFGLNGVNGLSAWPEGRAVELLYAASTDLGDLLALGVQNNSLITRGVSLSCLPRHLVEPEAPG
jgi:hypothetical protein